MSKTNDGGPAFARPGFESELAGRDYDGAPQSGMTLLDYFAGQALAGLLAFSPKGSRADDQYERGVAAEEAYDYAEAMVREREKRAK
jgi:hypothetical protein